MDYTYEGTLERVGDDWLASVPQFQGAYGGGHDIGEACANAAEALRLCIADALAEGEELPHPEFHEPPGTVFTVEVGPSYVEETGSVSATEAARMLGVSKGRISQLVRAGRLETVLVKGRSRVTLASIEARKAERG